MIWRNAGALHGSISAEKIMGKWNEEERKMMLSSQTFYQRTDWYSQTPMMN